MNGNQQQRSQNDSAIFQSVGRQFVQMTVEKEGLLQQINQIEQIADRLAQENHELKCRLSKHEKVDGYTDGKQSDGNEDGEPTTTGDKSKKKK